MVATTERKVPARAMAFAAALQLQPAGDAETTIRTGKVIARTSGVAFHWYWGRCVHDLSGMSFPKPRVPLDYCHNPCDVVGFAEGFDAAGGQLECDASLVTHRPEDRAAKLMADSDAGVPYEASILQSAAGLVVEWVEPDATVEVNGQSFAGPLVVFRQSTIRGLAICPQGADGCTSAEFSAGTLAGDVTISNFPGGFRMSTAPAAPAANPPAPPAAPANPPAASGLAANPPSNPSTAPAATAPTGQQFMDAFGEKGAVWFAQGKTYQEAQNLFNAEVVAKNKELTEQVQALTEANQKLRGASAPVSFDGAAPDQDKAKGQGFAGLIKLPGAAK
jgi:hypothetical protein